MKKSFLLVTLLISTIIFSVSCSYDSAAALTEFPTGLPTQSPTPNPTGTPFPTLSAVPSPTAPEVTEALSPSEAPAVTELPVPSEDPEATGVPVDPENPEVTEVPEPTEVPVTPEVTPSPIPTYTIIDMSPVEMYTTAYYNVREYPDITGEIIGGLPEGTKVTVIGRCVETGWYKIIYANDKTGYCGSRRLTTKTPYELDLTVIWGEAVPEHTASNTIIVDIGDVFDFYPSDSGAVNIKSFDQSLVTIDSTGKAKALRAGQTSLYYESEGSSFYVDIYVYDRHRADGMSSVKRESNDDLWLAADITLEDGTTIVRNTGVKIVERLDGAFLVDLNGTRFTVGSNQVMETRPAYVPTPALEPTDYAVKPGMLVNYSYEILSSGNALGLVDVKSNQVTSTLYALDGMVLQQEAIIPLSILARDCVLAGFVYFSIDSNGAYRTFDIQDYFWKNRLAANPAYGDDPYSNGGTKTVPGVSSEHRTGYAVDVCTIAAGYTWLNQNSWKYGFIHRYTGNKTQFTGVMDEYWHYTYVGRDIAETCFKENLCLEEYYIKYVFVD